MIDLHPLVVAARHGLADDHHPLSLDAKTFTDVLAWARADHLSGFLARAVLDGSVVVDDAKASDVMQQWHDELHVCVRLESLLVHTAQLLDEAAVTWRVTKGAALARLDYHDPELRTFGDVDIVVQPRDWTTAFDVLSAHGYHRPAPTLPGGYDDRYGKGATFTAAPDWFEVDLHRRFATGRFGVRSRMEDVFESHDSVGLAGRTIPCLDATGRLLHACFHAMLGRDALLRAFRDIAQLLIVTGADWETAFAIARSWRADAVVAHAIREAWTRLELSIEHPAHTYALTTQVSATDARVLREFPEMTFRRQALSALPHMRRLEVPRYLWTLWAGRRRRHP